MFGFLASGCLLLITLLGDPAEACICVPNHPQNDYCSADVVIKAIFEGNTVESGWKRYEIQTSNVYKGSEAMYELRFLYTANLASYCGYTNEPLQGEEYVIAGKLENGRVIITLCSFVQPWSWLSPEQQRGMSLDYSKGCNCTIVTCHLVGCSTDSKSQCLFTGTQANVFGCLPKSGTPGTCTWQSLS